MLERKVRRRCIGPHHGGVPQLAVAVREGVEGEQQQRNCDTAALSYASPALFLLQHPLVDQKWTSIGSCGATWSSPRAALPLLRLWWRRSAAHSSHADDHTLTQHSSLSIARPLTAFRLEDALFFHLPLEPRDSTLLCPPQPAPHPQNGVPLSSPFSFSSVQISSSIANSQ